MGRTFIAEERVQGILESSSNSNKTVIGIVIGQQTQQQKDYIIHAVETPKEDEWTGKLDTINDSWIANHAKQVQCMILGGLKVVGIYAVGTPEEMKAAPVKLRQIIFAVQKALNKIDIIPEDRETAITERLVLQMCSLTKKLTVRTFDMSDPKCAAKPAEWKNQSFLDRWIKLSSNISIDFHIPITMEMGNKSFRKQIQTGILPTCENIMNSLAVLNKQLYNDNDVLDTSKPQSGGGGGKKKAKKTEPEALSFEIDLFSQMTKSETTPDIKMTECCAKMYVRGTMCCRAVVHNKALAKDAIKALKDDVILTISRRCELLCEELIDEEEQDPRILYETPRRVFAKIPDTNIDICDYVFMDETAEDVQQRVQELLGLSVSQENIDFTSEKLPEEADLVKQDSLSSLQDGEKTPAKSSSLRYVGMVLGGAVAAIAAGISYLFVGDS